MGMTVEEAIKMAKADLLCMERDVSGQDEMCNNHKCDDCSLNYERGNVGEQKEWLRMAIKALEQEPCDVYDEYGNYKYSGDVELTEPNTATSMPCEATISRQAAIDEILKWVTRQERIGRYAVLIVELKQLCADMSSDLLPGTVKQRTGHWISIYEDVPVPWVRCSQCGSEEKSVSKFCPNCGCRMVEKESEVMK